MAEVLPFQGIRYNPERIDDMAAVVAPPYDVISPTEQERFYDRHPNNVIRLILGKALPDDGPLDNVHLRSARTFEQWLAEGVLITDAVPSYYLTTVTYAVGDQNCTRYGIIGRVRLEPFEKGIILPHERTYSKVKTERLLLRKACHANFSPIFGLYSDNGEMMERLRSLTESRLPTTDLIDNFGHRQRMWRLTDPRTIEWMARIFEQKRIYIADGHHRYETALNYRHWISENSAAFSSDHPANYVLISLSSMEDPGLTILPAHRLVRKAPGHVVATFWEKASVFFDVRTIALEGNEDEAIACFNAALADHAGQHLHAIGVYAKGDTALRVMVLKDGIMERHFGDELPEALRDLDVTVLTHLILMRLMGNDQAFLDDASGITYRTTTQDALSAVRGGDADLAFILNPTRIEQVRRVAETGLIMPRKSTYFFPKVISGQVFHHLRP